MMNFLSVAALLCLDLSVAVAKPVSWSSAEAVLALEMDEEDAVVLLQFGTQRVKQPLSDLHDHGKHESVADLRLSTNVRESERLGISEEELYDLDSHDFKEIEDGTWTFDVPVPISVTTWTGQMYIGSTNMISNMASNCHFNQLAHTADDITFFPPSLPGQKACCKWEYVISDPNTDIEEYDVVLFYLPYLMRTNWTQSLPTRKKEGQLWIATCAEPMFREETFMDCRLANDAAFMAHMDGFASYSGTSDFPVYFDTPTEEQMRRAIPDFESRGSELATMSFSDCYNPARNAFMEGIMAQFAAKGHDGALLSYGQCLHNAEEVPEKKQCKEGHNGFANRCVSRPFKVVAENNVEDWYITEKIWDAFYEGAIPVYFGPEQIKGMVPPNSILFAGDYASAEDLADAMLNFTEADFAKARAWKELPVSEWGEWADIRRNGHVTLVPRICEAAAKAKGATIANTEFAR